MIQVARSDAVADDGLPFVTVRSAEKTKDGIVIEGTAIVYEATVVIRVIDDQDQLLWHGFATASAGGPERGTFSATAPQVPGAQAVLLGPEEMEEGGDVARGQTARLSLDTI